VIQSPSVDRQTSIIHSADSPVRHYIQDQMLTSLKTNTADICTMLAAGTVTQHSHTVLSMLVLTASLISACLYIRLSQTFIAVLELHDWHGLLHIPDFTHDNTNALLAYM